MAAITAVVLAGGASRRMGSDKRLLRLFPASPMFLERTVVIGRSVADRVAVIGGCDSTGLGDQVVRIADDWPAEGPLGALMTALAAFPGDRLIVLASDYPMLQARLVARIVAGLDGYDAAVAIEAVSEQLHPLVGAYDAGRCVDDAGELFARGERTMSALLAQLTVRLVGEEATGEPAFHQISLTNVNSPDDLDSLRRLSAEIDARHA